MPLNVFTQFAKKGLKVAYRASTERQKLFVSFSLTGTFIGGDGAIAAELFTRIINEGGAGAHVFDPKTGFAEQLSGDTYPDGVTKGPHWGFEFEVAGVAPSFLRTAVEIFARSGGVVHKVKSMEIRGQLPVDKSAMSVETGTVLGWLDDPLGYPEAWPKPPFVVKDVEAPAGASIRLTPKKAPSADMQDQVLDFFQGWSELVTGALWAPGGEDAGVMQVTPQMGRSKKQITAAVNEFTYESKPARDALVNLLIGFHHRVTPLVEVEIALPQ